MTTLDELVKVVRAVDGQHDDQALKQHLAYAWNQRFRDGQRVALKALLAEMNPPWPSTPLNVTGVRDSITEALQLLDDADADEQQEAQEPPADSATVLPFRRNDPSHR